MLRALTADNKYPTISWPKHLWPGRAEDAEVGNWRAWSGAFPMEHPPLGN